MIPEADGWTVIFVSLTNVNGTRRTIFISKKSKKKKTKRNAMTCNFFPSKKTKMKKKDLVD